MSARKDMSIFQAILMSDDVRLASLARGTARSNLIRLERSEPGGTPSVGGRCYCGVGGILKSRRRRRRFTGTARPPVCPH